MRVRRGSLRSDGARSALQRDTGRVRSSARRSLSLGTSSALLRSVCVNALIDAVDVAAPGRSFRAHEHGRGQTWTRATGADFR